MVVPITPRPFLSLLLAVTPLIFGLTSVAHSATVEVQITLGDVHFDPKFVTIHPGDTVKWTWLDNKEHRVVSGSGDTGVADGLFDSGIHQAPFEYSVTFPAVGTFPYFCGVHRLLNIGGTWPVITVVADNTPGTGALENISARLPVGTGNDVLIGGFVIGGSSSKQLLLRALGPTLTQFGVPGALGDPTLELYNSRSELVISNDNWADAANAQSIPAGLRPPNNSESAILTSLSPGNYTAIVRGLNNATGVALVEGYDMDLSSAAHLDNISTRGFVQSGDNVMIAGIVVDAGNKNVILRALGPTLVTFGITNFLANPTLDLRDANGNRKVFNDDWKSTQQGEITATGYAPPNDSESAIVATLTPGNYTAIVSGAGNTTGVAIVEVYALP